MIIYFHFFFFSDVIGQSQLFLHHILLANLTTGEINHAVSFASHYEELVYFAHALEILLHTVVESEASMEANEDENSPQTGTLPRVIEFLDHFDVSLDVIVRCARKTEMARWKRLFDIVGNPKVLFEVSEQRTAIKLMFTLEETELLGHEPPQDCCFLPSCLAQFGTTRREQSGCYPLTCTRP